MRALAAAVALLIQSAAAFAPTAASYSVNRFKDSTTRRGGAVCCTASAAAVEPPLLQLLEERQLVAFFKGALDEPSAVVKLLKEAGGGGIIAYAIVAVSFYAVAGSLGELTFHAASGAWLDPRVLLLPDGAEGKAEVLAALASFYLFCKPFAPVRLGGALLLTPDVKRFIDNRPALVSFFGQVGALWDGSLGRAIGVLTAGLRRAALKDELLELARECRGGIDQLDDAKSARLDEIVTTLLPSLNPTANPARSELFSGEWECRWTTESELNFAVDKGLFGLPWERTYQRIDVASQALTNVILFVDGALTVGSSIAPDEADGSRFNFAFRDCSLRYKGLTVPLPPVGRGWGELLFLDDELRIQRDIRGDLLVAERVVQKS